MINIARYLLAFAGFSLVALGAHASTDRLQIVAFGTSFTFGKGVYTTEAFPARLEALLQQEGFPVLIKNQGVNGDTTFDLLGRVNKAVPEGTHIVIFEYALGNDRRGGVSVEDTVKNSEQVISQLLARGIRVLLLIRGDDEKHLRQRAKLFKGVISKYGILSLQIEQPETSLLSDHQHPHAEAHKAIAASMVTPVKKLIEQVNSKPGS